MKYAARLLAAALLFAAPPAAAADYELTIVFLGYQDDEDYDGPAVFKDFEGSGAISFRSKSNILLFSGHNNDDFLGCYDCSKYDSDSICNKYGTYGSKYTSNSIWNKYGSYGSKYSSSSPWNKFSSSDDVPVLVDRQGNYYGYFTINKYRSDAFNQARQLATLFDKVNGDLSVIRDAICD